MRRFCHCALRSRVIPVMEKGYNLFLVIPDSRFARPGMTKE